MTYVVTEACIRCKYMDCVEVCPVDCFYEGENMLVINPDECIDCGVCEPECPVEAILPDTEDEAEKWLELNREYSTVPGPISPARASRRRTRTTSRTRRASSTNTSAPSRDRAERPRRAGSRLAFAACNPVARPRGCARRYCTGAVLSC